VAAAWAAPALACPVCYGDASDPVLDGTKISIAFLGSLVYLLLFGGVGMAVVVRRRALRTMDDSGRPRPAAPQETSER
jgi:hypothetical protein